MICIEQLDSALVPLDGRVPDVTKIEFEVLENGTLRWLLWERHKRLYACTLDRQDLIEALQASGVLLRTMQLGLREDIEESTDGS